jgi:hypothetical protein
MFVSKRGVQLCVKAIFSLSSWRNAPLYRLWWMAIRNLLMA